jgi:hypothetical protein
MPLLGRLLSAGRSGRWAEEESTSDAASSSLSTAGRLSSQLSGGVVGLGRLASRLQSEASLLSPFPRFNLASALESAQVRRGLLTTRCTAVNEKKSRESLRVGYGTRGERDGF